jgi:hypothetical protein
MVKDIPQVRAYYEQAAYQIDKYNGAPTRIFTGCASGVDTDFFKGARGIWGNVPVTLVIPDAPYNEEFVVRMKYEVGTEIIRVPAEGTTSQKYMARNDVLASEADRLMAFPQGPHEQMRSGTWATIRRFKNRGKLVNIYPLKGVQL